MPPVDVFVAHNSPRRVHDQEDGIHTGFEAFNDYVRLHGHQHVDAVTLIGRTLAQGVYGMNVVSVR